MAAALDAEWCEICSDVDGVYSADPRVVPGAQRIAALSYPEMQEMAEAGAKVLNAQAVEFAKDHGIAIYARATAQPPPGSGAPSDGTVVRKFAPRPPGTVVSIASESDLLVLQAGQRGLGLLDFLDTHKVAGKQLHYAGCGGPADGLNLVLSRENLHDEERFLSHLSHQFGTEVGLRDGVGAVSVIGTGINSSYKNLLKGSRALADYELLGISTSSFRITWLLPAPVVADSVRRLHHLFLEAEMPVVP